MFRTGVLLLSRPKNMLREPNYLFGEAVLSSEFYESILNKIHQALYAMDYALSGLRYMVLYDLSAMH